MDELDFTPTLGDLGYRKVGRQGWVRSYSEVEHVVSPSRRASRVRFQWGLVVPGAVDPVWDITYTPGAVEGSVMTGTAAGLRHSDGARCTPESLVANPSAVISRDIDNMDKFMSQFTTRRSIADFLIHDFDNCDRRYVFPGNETACLLVIAVLLQIDGDERVRQFTEEACLNLAKVSGPLSRHRIAALRG